MKRDNLSLSGRTAQRIRKRMLKDIFEENLHLNGLSKKKPHARGRRGLFFKALVLFVAFFSFSVYKNSDFGDYHTLPALPLTRYMTDPPARPAASAKRAAERQTAKRQAAITENTSRF